MRELRRNEWLNRQDHHLIWSRGICFNRLIYRQGKNEIILKEVMHIKNFIRSSTSCRRFLLTESEANSIIVSRFI